MTSRTSTRRAFERRDRDSISGATSPKQAAKACQPAVVYTTAWQRYLYRLRRLVWAR